MTQQVKWVHVSAQAEPQPGGRMLCTALREGQRVVTGCELYQPRPVEVEFHVYSASGMPVLRSGHPVLGYSMMCKAVFCQTVYFTNF